MSFLWSTIRRKEIGVNSFIPSTRCVRVKHTFVSNLDDWKWSSLLNHWVSRCQQLTIKMHRKAIGINIEGVDFLKKSAGFSWELLTNFECMTRSVAKKMFLIFFFVKSQWGKKTHARTIREFCWMRAHVKPEPEKPKQCFFYFFSSNHNGEEKLSHAPFENSAECARTLNRNRKFSVKSLVQKIETLFTISTSVLHAKVPNRVYLH